jgi:hypothetical protein
MTIFRGASLFDGYTPILTEQLLTESNQTGVTKEAIKQKFEELGIFEAEQLIAIANNNDRIFALANTLSLNEYFVQNLITKSKEKLGDKAGFYLKEGYHRTLGLILEGNINLINEQFGNNDFFSISTGNAELDRKSVEVSNSLNVYIPSANNIHYLSFIPFVGDQQQHPSCAAFAASSSNEFRLTYSIHNGYRNYINLSESSLFCEVKKIDGTPSNEGTSLYKIANVLGTIGQAKKGLYPYEGHDTNLCANHTYRQAINSSDLANQKAGIICVNPKSIIALKSAIENRHLPYVGVELFESVWNARTNENGFINMPLNGELKIGGHAICLVGYFDDSTLPGGGAFIFKNSWGVSWSFDNIFNRPGFGLISYSYIVSYCSQAFLTI